MASAVATPLERRFGRIAGVTEMTSASALGSTSITLQFDLDRDVDGGRARRAGGDQRRGRRAAGEPADAPQLPQGQPRRLADPDPVADLGHAAARRRSSTPPTASWRRRSRRSRGVGQVFVGGGQQPAVRVQVDPHALAGMGLGLEDVRTALAAVDRRTSPRASLAAARVRRTRSPPTISCSAPTAYRDADRRLRERRARVRLGDVANVFDDVENNRARGLDATGTARC